MIVKLKRTKTDVLKEYNNLYEKGIAFWKRQERREARRKLDELEKEWNDLS